jgi:hypothetical protein
MAKQGRDYGVAGENDRTRKLTTKKLRARVLTVFQKLRRVEEADANGICTCCTCGARMAWNDKNCHGGHYIPREHNATTTRKENVNVQCANCNKYSGGKPVAHRAYIVERYGEEKAAELDRLKRTIKTMYRSDWFTLLTTFNERLKSLLKERGWS